MYLITATLCRAVSVMTAFTRRVEGVRLKMMRPDAPVKM